MGTRSKIVETYDNGQLVDTHTITWTTSIDQDNADTLRDKAAQALTANAAFLAINSPAAAQVATQVKALTRQVNGILRLLVVADTSTITDS